MTEQQQVNALWELQGGGHGLEDELIQAHVARISHYQGGGIHASDVYEVLLETGRLAYFKPANGLLGPVGKRALANYDQTPLSSTISECAAWQIAKGLGEPWASLVPPTVLRFIALPNGGIDVGSLVVFRPGEEKRRGYLDAVPDQAVAGAFFDALIGQQDRNEGNVLWYERRRVIYLIDHAFCFARPGANSGEVALTTWRAGQGLRDLSGPELDALTRLEDERGFGLPSFLEPTRMRALEERIRAMQNSGRMPLVGGF